MNVFDRLLARMRERKLLKAGAPFAKYPKQAPTSFSAAAHDNWATAVGLKTGVPYPKSAEVKTPWRYLASLDVWDGADAGGVRDVVSANAGGLDDVKGDVDVLGQAIIELRADVKALQEAPPTRPFP